MIGYVMNIFKSLIYWFDRIVFKGVLKKYRIVMANDRFFSEMERGLEGKMLVAYNKKNISELAILCDKYGSDKGSNIIGEHPYPWPPHSYVDFYELLFKYRRNQIRAVFECGIGSANKSIPANMGPYGRPGASLRVWRDYFPMANIYGADIDKDILFQEDRISTFYIDQMDNSVIKKTFEIIGNISFDIIIDDGLHTFDAGLILFKAAWERIAVGGVYIIEDVGRGDLMRFKNFFELTSFDVAYVSLQREGEMFGDHSLVVIHN